MMKINILKTLLTIACLLCSIGVYAHDFEVNGIYYKIKNNYNDVEVTYKGNAPGLYAGRYVGDIIIPSTVSYRGKSYNVSAIGDWAFNGCSGLQSVSIPESITLIGEHVTGGNNIDIYINNLSAWCKIKFNSALHADNLYINNTLVEDLLIPEEVTSISAYAFVNFKCLKSVSIGNNISFIGEHAFLRCDSLNSVYIEDLSAWCKIEFAGDGANPLIKAHNLYLNNKLVTNLIIPEDVISLGNYAFDNCTSLTEVTISNNTTSIGIKAFNNCANLTSVSIGNNINIINESAFIGCIKLTSITIPSSTQVIDNYAFERCEKLNKIIIEDSENTLKLGYAGTNLGLFSSIPIDTLYLGRNLSYSTNYSKGYSPFYGNINLKLLTISNSVTNINQYAFGECTGIEKIICKAIIPPVIYSSTFQGIDKTIPLYVDEECVEKYQKSEYWKQFINIKRSFVSATSLTINSSSANLCVGDNIKLEITILPNNASNKTILWGTSNKEIVTVDNGIVTAHKVGTATITATTTDGSNLTAICEVTVAPTLATSIALDQTEVTLKATETVTLAATILPESTTDMSVVWTSSDSEVATVENGVVTAHKVGTATITATTTDGSNLTATCEVTVAPTLATSITLDQTAVTLKATESATLTATVLPETTTNKEVIWTSNDSEVASVENGIVTAHKVGTATITATTTDGSYLTATCEVTVAPTLATSITLDQTAVTLKATESATLTATVLPETTTNKEVIWTSSDSEVASVENGVVTAHKVGTATITTTTTDGSNLTATCEVTVEETLATSITLDQTAVTLKATESATLTATVLPETTTDKGVEWSSSDESVATVADGVVTAHKVGTATITATTTDGSNLSATCEVTVEATLATSITLDQTNITAIEGETVVLTATIYPDDVTEKGVVWSVSDATIATIEPIDNVSAKITVLREGVATITATTIDGSNLSATCTIDVYSGIKNVQLDDTPTEYYDLSGRRVEHPTQGVYITKQGSTVRKVVVNER